VIGKTGLFPRFSFFASLFN